MTSGGPSTPAADCLLISVPSPAAAPRRRFPACSCGVAFPVPLSCAADGERPRPPYATPESPTRLAKRPRSRIRDRSGNQDGALAGGFLAGPGLPDVGERDLARPDLDRARADLRHKRRQLGQVTMRRYRALAAALEAEVGRAQCHGRQLDR